MYWLQPAAVFCAAAALLGVTEAMTCSASAAQDACGTCGASQPGVAMIQRTRALVNRAALKPDTVRSLAQVVNGEITVISYNLFWWNVAANNRWAGIYQRISENLPFDLIGFQECENIEKIVNNAGLENFDFFQGPYLPNPAPMAWNRATFDRIGEPGTKWVARDQWGDRWMNWVRLRHRATGTPVLFVNTHGPLGPCGADLGENWVDGILENREEGDVVFMTGDYNCRSGTQAMNELQVVLSEQYDGGIDHIFTSGRAALWGMAANGQPSDHPLIIGKFSLLPEEPTTTPTTTTETTTTVTDTTTTKTETTTSTSETPTTTRTDTTTSTTEAPTTTSSSSTLPDQNYYRKIKGVGAWGGWCTCPDGQRYQVGDNLDVCGSIACEGGVAGLCERVMRDDRLGMAVTCAAAPKEPPKENYYRKASGYGSWGGVCTCPDGQQYDVGDRNDGCAAGSESLGCVGGVAGECERIKKSKRAGMIVTCAPPGNLTAQNKYRRMPGVGSWGGSCTCPDGTTYNVGDKNDACKQGPLSLACEGGVPGECIKERDVGRSGMAVTCAAPPIDCEAFEAWPDVDGQVTCGNCKALVFAAPYSGRCDRYCASFGHVCVDAAEEIAETCVEERKVPCDVEINGTSDMLCTCKRPR
mmetsp:Transcript_69896/g.202571  ORF Transcript_69896/g.202571 Transcript_69896/m.202571 type:complete len:642 (-) Transcript_69896:180-2105(-)